jgi:predicted tellurium resistance membrane protein TerC
VTTNAFIVFTSNVFAILGLRALYFLLAGMLGMFRYLKLGLSFVLGFVGSKMIASILTVAIAASLLAARREGRSEVGLLEEVGQDQT